MTHELLEDDARYFDWVQSQAYVSFATELRQEKQKPEENFVRALFLSDPLSLLSPNEKLIYCYRAGLSLYPENSEALFGLAHCLSKGAELSLQDLVGTRYESKR